MSSTYKIEINYSILILKAHHRYNNNLVLEQSIDVSKVK